MLITSEDIEKIIITIQNHSPYDFSGYSIKSFTRRIEKATFDFKLSIDEIIKKIKTDEIFTEKLAKGITVNTTELFRDPKVWHTLRYRVLNKFSENRRINIWHAGSSTGQEVYSMLILLNEMGLLEKANVFASDINTDVLEVAKKGVYNYRFNMEYFDNFNKVIRENPFNYDDYLDVPYSKYFNIEKEKDTISIKDFLKRKVVWLKHDLVNQSNIFDTKFDLILCRNVLIYFNNELQEKVIETFYNSLFRKGVLIIGIHESIIGLMANKFNKSGFVYTKKE
ncbi:MAG: hypothetical protein JXR51_16830 [Bacteroidales bacterium]|nr:hypothetical protein [Bacteroidales bacterium]MBN2758834.1 hypothetical protein [Bacteroidales bacterium]